MTYLSYLHWNEPHILDLIANHNLNTAQGNFHKKKASTDKLLFMYPSKTIIMMKQAVSHGIQPEINIFPYIDSFFVLKKKRKKTQQKSKQ